MGYYSIESEYINGVFNASSLSHAKKRARKETQGEFFKVKKISKAEYNELGGTNFTYG